MQKERQVFSFTIIELLIVVAVIMILASLLLPALNRARESAQRIVCSNNMKNLYQATAIYDTDFNNLIPMYSEVSGTAPAGYPGYYLKLTRWHGFGKLYEDDYIKTGKTFYCPSKNNMRKDGSYYGRLSYDGYGGDAHTNGWHNQDAASRVENNYWLRWSESTYLEEGASSSIAQIQNRLYKNSPNRWLAVDTWGTYAVSSDSYWLPHPGGLNVLFIDGHVQFFSYKLVELMAGGGSTSSVVNKIVGTYGNTSP
jgi:prepilin-type processing-associated H-X9-DG protein